MRAKEFWIMDYETIVNCFVGVFSSYSGDSKKIFVIHHLRNDIVELVDFLRENAKYKDWHFGFNNLAFDAQITEFILSRADHLKNMESASDVAEAIYAYAQSVIEKSNNGEWLDYPEFKLSIPCVDIFKLNHWDNNAKRSSLKWIQFTMDWHNVEEMPHPHNEPVRDEETLVDVIDYCINDVESTKAIFKLEDSKGEKVMSSQINLRAQLSKKYNLSLYSASEPKISKQIFLHFLSEKLGRDKKEIRDLRTYRSKVTLRDIILPYIKFETPEFTGVLNWFKSLEVDTRILDEGDKKSGPKHRMMHKNVPTDYALGGIHGCIKSGIYEAGPGKKIMTADVTSFYPFLAITNGWAPSQIPKEEFCELYKGFFDERKKYAKGTPLNYLFKIILNSTYGLSKSRYSFLYDPELTFRITVNGQLLLSMLYEMLSTRIPGSIPLMQNTDGLEFIIDEEYEDEFNAICKEWEELTMLQLEIDEYQKMIIGDVNNYIAVYKNGKTKCKGRFEFDGLALHKNKSHLIIPKALYAYFVYGKNPKEYLQENRDIFDYCIGAKIRGNWYFEERGIDKGEYFSKKLQKLVRYYVSGKGTKIIKCNPDGREIQLESGPHLMTLFNQYEEKSWEDYGVDEKYYLDKIYDEIEKIESDSSTLPQNESVQLSLF
jgi:hypothetical protein